jgi:hypothetical protein
MELIFNLHWLREGGCDTGTPTPVNELEDAIRDRVIKAAIGAEGRLALKLPFLDLREMRRRTEVLGDLHFQRCGNEVLPLLTPRLSLRTAAAEVAMLHPAWANTPSERELTYFRTWQRVSNALQASLRNWIPGEYFRDAKVYEDREAAYPMIVYQAARVYHGNPAFDFTYDLRDYPDCRDTLESIWRRIGDPIQKVLEGVEQRLYDAGLTGLSRRYAPRWHEDVLLEVQRKPKAFFKLISVETDVIDAIIGLGTARSCDAVCRFGRTANLRLRNLHGRDCRAVAIRALRETTRVLSEGS